MSFHDRLPNEKGMGAMKRGEKTCICFPAISFAIKPNTAAAAAGDSFPMTKHGLKILKTTNCVSTISRNLKFTESKKSNANIFPSWGDYGNRLPQELIYESIILLQPITVTT